MRIPPLPPDFFDWLRNPVDADRYMAMLLSARDLNDDYRPWREIRFRTPPSEVQHRFSSFLAQNRKTTDNDNDIQPLTTREWWFLLYRNRLAQTRRIPLLTTTNGHPLRFALPDGVLRETDFATTQLSGRASGFVDTEPERERYLKTALEEEAITSSQLEGAATTRRAAKEMLRSGRRPRTLSERMIINNYQAMQRVRELRDTSFSPDLVRELHSIVTEGTLDDPADAGRLQTDTEARVSVQSVPDGDELHRPPPAVELPIRLERLCDFANGLDDGPYLPGVLRALTVHFMASYDHYFVDGNGRTARALFYWSMLRQGYWLAEYLTISTILRKSPSKYGRSFLDTEQDDGDLTYFFIYHLGVLHRAIDGLHDYIARTVESQQMVRRRLSPATGEFNLRQITILGDALQDPQHHFTAREIANRFAVTEQTGRQDLTDLEQRGLLVRRRVGHKFAWTAIRELAERLTPATSGETSGEIGPTGQAYHPSRVSLQGERHPD